MTNIVSPQNYSFILGDGYRPANNGTLYIGKAGTDPTVTNNQIPVNGRKVDGTISVLTQPISLNSNGKAVDGTGASVDLLVDTHYSFAVYDAYGKLSQSVSTQLVVEVDGFSTLRNLPVIYEGQRVTLLGWNKGSNVGGGVFVGHKGTNTDDGGVIAAGSGFYWQRIVDVPFYIVDWFGAKGDGTSDDTVAIQQAISTAKTGEVRFRDGATYLTGNLIFNAPTTLNGVSKRGNTRLSPFPGTTGNHFTVATYLAPTFKNLNLVGDWTTVGSRVSPTPPTVLGALNAIWINDQSSYQTSIQMESCTISNYSGYGIYVGTNRNMGRIDYSSVLYCGLQCLYITSAVDWLLDSCSFGRSLSAEGIYANCGSFRMSNSESYENQGNGLTLGPLAVVTAITRNHFNTNGNNGIYFNTSGGTEGHVCTDNLFFANGWRSTTADDVTTNKYANIRIAKSITNFKASNVHYNYGGTLTERRVAYCVYREGSASSLNMSSMNDVYGIFGVINAGVSAEIGYSNFDTEASRFDQNGLQVGFKHSVQSFAYTPTTVTYSAKTYYKTYNGLQLTPTNIMGGTGDSAPTNLIGWNQGRLFLYSLSAPQINFSEISNGAAIPSTNIAFCYYAINTSDSAFTLPQTSSLTNGQVVRFKKVVAAGNYTFTPTANSDSSIATIYGPTGAALTSVVISAVGTYEFIWNSTRNAWIFS